MKNEIELVETCGACPEQYNAFLNGRQVGYLRLRHGSFTVECPDSGDELVYSASPAGDGIFEPDEREFYLHAAKQAIYMYVENQYQESIADSLRDAGFEPTVWG